MKREIKQEQSRRVKTSDLGGAALFLGGNFSTSILDSDYPDVSQIASTSPMNLRTSSYAAHPMMFVVMGALVTMVSTT